MKKLIIFMYLLLITLVANAQNIVPRVNGEGSIGTENKFWNLGYFYGIRFNGSTNELSYLDGRLLYGGEPIVGGITNLIAGKNILISTNSAGATIIRTTDDVEFQDVLVRGTLTVVGVENIVKTIYYTTNIYVGIRTNYVTTDIYTTNWIAERTVVYVTTRTTNYVDDVINIGGSADYSKAMWMSSPVFYIDNSDTNHPVLRGSNTWDLTDCSITLGSLTSLDLNGDVITEWPHSGVNKLIVTNAAISNDVKFVAGTNIVINLDSDNNEITINATGGGTWTPQSRVIADASNEVTSSDYLLWMNGDAAGTNQILILPEMLEQTQTIIVRQLSDVYNTDVMFGTNSYSLVGNGDWVAFDWLGPDTEVDPPRVGMWYWRN